MTKYLLEKGYEKIYVCARKNAGVDHETLGLDIEKHWASREVIGQMILFHLMKLTR